MAHEEEIAAQILSGALEPAPTFEHEGLVHTVEEQLRLPKDFHHPETRLAPVEIVAYAHELGARAIVRSGKWEKYVIGEKGYGLRSNPNPHGEVHYETVGVLRCNAQTELSLAPRIATAWLGTICSVVKEREMTDEEEEQLRRGSYQLENVGFLYARSVNVRSRGQFIRWLTRS